MLLFFKCKSYVSICALETFVINGIDADYEDFGVKEDINPAIAEEYGCGNMKFISKPATQEVLEKYNINADDYGEICRKLDEELSFGQCGWCI